MTEPLDFHSAGEFRQWLMSNHQPLMVSISMYTREGMKRKVSEDH